MRLTRKTIKSEIQKISHIMKDTSKVYNTIDKLFDMVDELKFDKELANQHLDTQIEFNKMYKIEIDTLKSRTCENCKFIDRGYCNIDRDVETVDGLGCMAKIEVELTDFCHKWEKR